MILSGSFRMPIYSEKTLGMVNIPAELDELVGD